MGASGAPPPLVAAAGWGVGGREGAPPTETLTPPPSLAWVGGVGAPPLATLGHREPVAVAAAAQRMNT